MTTVFELFHISLAHELSTLTRKKIVPSPRQRLISKSDSGNRRPRRRFSDKHFRQLPKDAVASHADAAALCWAGDGRASDGRASDGGASDSGAGDGEGRRGGEGRHDSGAEPDLSEMPATCKKNSLEVSGRSIHHLSKPNTYCECTQSNQRDHAKRQNMNTVRSLAHLRSNGSVDARNIVIENALHCGFRPTSISIRSLGSKSSMWP